MGGHHPLSLQKLTYFYLHRKLTKTHQCSNWNRRPLSTGQLRYAACDALVLLHLYDEITRRLRHETKPFKIDQIAYVLDVNVKPSPRCTLCFQGFASASQLKAHRSVCCRSVVSLRVCSSCSVMLLNSDDHMQQHIDTCGVADHKAKTTAVKRITGNGARKQAVVLPSKTRKRRLSMGDTSEPAAPVAGACSNRCLKRAKPTPQGHAVDAKEAEPTDAVAEPVQVEDDHQDKGESTNLLEGNTSSQQLQKKKKKRKRKKKRNHQPTQTLNACTPLPDRDGHARPRTMSVDSALLAADDIWSQVSSDNAASQLSP